MVKRKGFTLIEVTLFLAVTAALFIGIVWGMQSAINRQRYDEATQEFFEFMRSVYSKVSNPQSPGSGNSTKAIYGKLVVFSNNAEDQISMYDVVGQAVSSKNIGEDSLTSMLKTLNVTLTSKEKYNLPWQTTIQKENNGPLFTGSFLVVRHPRSGTINTLYWNGTQTSNFKNVVTNFTPNGEILLCVSPYPVGKTGPILKRPVRILAGARNASDVELIDLDSTDNKCN